jgi:Flp pilus assembly protein TadB
MEWTQFIILALAMAGMFFWNRAEARADARKSDADNKELRRELIEVMRSLHEEGRIFREQWAAESRDFHGRLCAIEERRK